jgi:hypothetical protein
MLCSELASNSAQNWLKIGVNWQVPSDLLVEGQVYSRMLRVGKPAEPDRSCSKCNRADICDDKSRIFASNIWI